MSRSFVALLTPRFCAHKNKACLHCKQGFFSLQTRLVFIANKASLKMMYEMVNVAKFSRIFSVVVIRRHETMQCRL